MDTWRYLPLSINDAALNMAIDEAILNARIANSVPNTLRFYSWRPSAVSVGRNQTLQNEVYLDTAHHLGVDVVRRLSGGGAVYHDLGGEVTYSVIARVSDLGTVDPTTVYTKIYDALTDALRLLGVPADYSSGDAKNCPNLTVLGRKISGSSQIISRGVVLQHGTLLVNLDLPQMFRVLQLKGVSCTQAADIAMHKITSIQTELGHKISLNTVANALAQGFKAVLRIHLQEGGLTSGEEAIVVRLQEKYRSTEWMLGSKI
ncbi:biotin/lipoate A/B protein ligase family protein [Candidatus Bathycorpusculum sp.]|uniref:lipoate--protein ligase family protein n=1 Tax=Candidatus Bathycorpusculum sp. TaxID=2994959 RepID=UPI002817BCDB|nr:lipoate--protein ligase family protein [Candidatus Termitimicrobium sp.]MCL2432840.1 lipoate--protein ligase family protein [Candidatus Termitimicrobium sp.]